jgi:hypothetical protein
MFDVCWTGVAERRVSVLMVGEPSKWSKIALREAARSASRAGSGRSRSSARWVTRRGQLGRRNSVNPASVQRRAAATMPASPRQGLPHPHAYSKRDPRSPRCSITVAGSGPSTRRPMTPDGAVVPDGVDPKVALGGTVTFGDERRRVPRHSTCRWGAGMRAEHDDG